MLYELTHANHDPNHCLVPNLFRCIAPARFNKEKLNTVYKVGTDFQIEFTAAEPLGARECVVLSVLVAMAGLNGKSLTSSTRSLQGKHLLDEMDPRWDAKSMESVMVKTSFRKVAKEAGYGNIDDTKSIRTAIERLWKVTVIVQKGSKRLGFRLLSHYQSETEPGSNEGELIVALNPMITSVIFGNVSKFIRIDLQEVRGLKSDAAMLIHLRLCAFINQGGARYVRIDKLKDYAYGTDTTGLSSSAIRRREQSVRRALDELKTLGWIIQEKTVGSFLIQRPGPEE